MYTKLYFHSRLKYEYIIFQCVVDELKEGPSEDTDEIYVEHEITDNGMILEASNSNKKQSIPLCVCNLSAQFLSTMP